MGFFNRDFRCFDNDSIDTAAMMESIFESTYDAGQPENAAGIDDIWSTGSTADGSWSSSDD